ncbi:MAG: hypothetical protein K1X53_00670 [Candidatus Sumerlaeaceae bacterium]|nr:hypothetical protein [Candidatus Sumerlaeaceae bacterium]
MTGFVIVFFLVFVVTFLIISFYFYRQDSKHASVAEFEDYRLFLDIEGNPEAIEFTKSHGEARTYERTRLGIEWVHMFLLGLLSGFGICLTIAKYVFAKPDPANCVLWVYVWLCFVLVAWLGSFLFERIKIARMQRKGFFDDVIEHGADPLPVAAGILLPIKRFRIWLVVLMFTIGAAMTLFDRYGVVVGIFLGFMAVTILWRTHKGAYHKIRLLDLEQQLLSAQGYMREGGWVAPTGTLMCTASLGLMYFWDFQHTMLMLVMNLGILLVLWSEYASRTAAEKRSIEDWRTVLRQRLASIRPQLAVVETI